MQGNHRAARLRTEVLSAHSMLALAVSHALASCRRAATASRRRDAQAALALAAATALAVASVPARAQETTWTGAVSSDWFDGGNWSGGVPRDATDALIDTASNSAEIDAGDASVHILTIGAAGAGSLSIINGGTLSSHWGAIGDGGEGVVTVAGAGSSWRTRQFDVIVGWGSSGELFVQDGGLVEANRDITIGQASNSRGEVVVTGAGSRLISHGSSIVGVHGIGSLTIRDGGQAISGGGVIALNQGSTGEATVAGADSRWSNTGNLTVGDRGNGLLVVESGGTVDNQNGVIGNQAGSVGMVTVTGDGSSWINREALTVGGDGNGLLQVLDGGTVESQSAVIGHGFVDYDEDAIGSSVEVIGSGTTWTNAGELLVGENSLATMEVLVGGQVQSGSVYLGTNIDSEGRIRVNGFDAGGVHSRLVIAGDLLVGDAGTGKLLVDNAGFVNNVNGTIGNAADSAGRALVTGAGSVWTNSGALSVGRGGEGILEILDGGRVESESGSIGTEEGSDGVVRVGGVDSTGTGSSWEIDGGNLTIGDAGTGTLLVEAGGTVSNQHGFIGGGEGAVGKVTVMGAGSSWNNNGGALYIGNAGAGTLDILGGGVVSSAQSVVSNGGDATVLVDGEGSRWNAGESLVVGNFGAGQVTLDNGGVVTSTYGIVGNQGDVQSTMLVRGPGSAWSGLQDLYVGFAGNGALTIDAGGLVENAFAVIGSETGSTGSVTVTGAGSSWANSGNLAVGYFGAGTLLIQDGATVDSDHATIADQADSVSEVTVTGAGSRWTSVAPTIAYLGNGTLSILDGGEVSTTGGSFDVGGSIGMASGSHGQVLVAGMGSNWTNDSDLLVGEEGSGTLRIEDAGLVSNTGGYVGWSTDSVGEVTVTGAGSSWINTGDLHVGRQGNGTLTVEAGGVVENVDGRIGSQAGSIGSVTVTGAGSTWTNEDELHVGSGGSGVLEILDGGRATGWDVYISRYTGSDGVLKVSGTDSSVAAVQGVFVGYEGSGTLLVEAGGSLSSGFVSIANRGSPDAKATATGSGTTWNSGALFLGNGGGLGELEILDGAMVNSGLTQVGQNSDGTALVDGPGSQWYVGPLVVNSAHHAQVVVRNGGLLSSATGIVGNLGDLTGTVRIQGAGSAWINLEDLYIGSFIQEPGTGALTIDDGGRVEVHAGNEDFDVMLARIAGSTGTLNIGAGGAAGVLDSASVTGGAGNAILNFNHDEADYAFTNDGTAGGTAVLIDGTTTVDQIGTGTTTLLGANTYTGATHVGAGTLLVEGSLGNTATTVADGATLGGSGSIAGAVTIADGGILAPGSSAGTLTVGSLSLSSGSILDYELGQAGVIGGGVNDLIEVTGDLTLDGTLNITDIGGFGAGVYRLINYGGDLTDNGLALGLLPTGVEDTDLLVQTAFDGQVNLVSTAGLTLNFWDGAVDGERNNGAIDGGDGSWVADDRNWTQADGALNGHWDNGEFAVFGGTAGNVEVVGEQAIAGLQLMSGYTLTTGTDGALRIDGADSVIRVDPDVTATIAAPITGAGGLVKTDTGTLVLSGANSYEGGTRIDRGTLRVASDGNLGDAAGGLAFDGGTLQTTAAFDSARDVDLQDGGGIFLVDADLGLDGVISGAGALTKDGDGTLTLSGDNAYGGGTRVLNGTLVGDNGSIRGNLDNDARVVFDQGVDGAFAGAITGDGAMAKRGVGALTLTGSSALDWNIDAGTLVATGSFTGDAAIADSALLRLAQSGDATYSGVLSGAGGFESGGSGTLVLDGDNAAFAGATRVDAGTLQVDGALGGNVEVGADAALSGDGTLGGAVRVLDSGRLAPGAGVGTLTLGSLWLSDGATLDYGLGQAGTVGGGANDLLEIVGDLTLDGALSITDVGGFGAGVYRLINYGGELTDNTLDFGALPDGFEAGDLFVQTAVDGQVNLVNSAGAVLGFWDGVAGPADDGAIQGGNGVWTSAGRSWTDGNGAINGRWSTGFAVFGGKAGTVTVDGTQAFTGLQFMTDGYLVTEGALAMETPEAIVRVDPGVTATIDSALTGSGALVKHDAGTLVLAGENSYAGGTQLLGGVLAVGGDANLGATDGALTFDGGGLRMDAAFDSVRDIVVGANGGALDSGAFDATLAGAFSGSGTFTRIGSGALTLVGASHGFGGTFALQSGELRVDGGLGGTLAIANGAWLTGIGTLHDVDNHGTVAAGHSIGTLTLTGDYVHHDDATLLAEIEPGGGSDLLDIAGSATIEGGTVQVIKLPGQYEGGTRYTLIDAAGGVTGTFGELGQDLPFLDLLLGYDADHVYLDVQRSEADFDIVCGTGTFNQCQVAGALDAVGHDHPIPDDLEPVLTEVTALSLPGAQAAFDTLSGEAHGSLAGILLEGHALYGQTVSRRIAERRGQTGGERLQGGAWVRAYGSSSDLDGDGNAHAADFEQRGLAIGFDAWGDEHWLVGASFNAMDIEADFRPGDRGEAEAWDASLYATFEGGHAYLDAVTSFAWWDNEVTRRIAVGSIEREARSKYGGHRFAIHLEAGWNFALGRAQQLTPLVSVEYAMLAQDGFREDGADDLDLVGRSQDVERTTVTAGLRWRTAFEHGDWTFEPTVQARWLHAFGDGHAEQAVAFAGAPEVGYRVRGVSWAQDRGLLGVGVQLRRGDNLDLFVDIDYQKGAGLEAKNLGAGLRWRW